MRLDYGRLSAAFEVADGHACARVRLHLWLTAALEYENEALGVVQSCAATRALCHLANSPPITESFFRIRRMLLICISPIYDITIYGKLIVERALLFLELEQFSWFCYR